uniref:pyridoxal 5'-phosphate synthase n=1 Tax=Timema californicum TaxID=61474 RepID=A0A7R9JCU6_TIMCA|nr:unnamed protein product [Timema californicum]
MWAENPRAALSFYWEALKRCVSTISLECLRAPFLCYEQQSEHFFCLFLPQKGQVHNSPLASSCCQVRVEGRVEKLPEEESDSYFHSRPLESQIGSSVSAQSTPIPSRETLTQRELQLAAEYGDGKKELPRPSHWGGYVVIPESVEFWQGQTTRIHDRIRFRRPRSGEQPDGVMLHQGESGWVYERLSP